MKYFICYLSVFICFQISTAQKVALPDLFLRNDSAYYKGLPFTGYCYEYFTNGKLKYEANYVSGQKEEKETKYYNNGVRRLEITYCEGKRDEECSYKYFSIDGQLRSEIDYEKGVKTGSVEYAEIFYYPIIVGEKDGKISRTQILNNKTIEVKILKTYRKYFTDKGVFDTTKYHDIEFSDNLNYLQGTDIALINFRMKGELPIYPPRETIFDHIDYNGKSEAQYLSQSMKDNFKNMLLQKVTIEETTLRTIIDNKNILWQLPARELIIVD